MNYSDFDFIEVDSARPIISIVGPSCTGKTGLSLYLAKKLGLEIINADSRLIYSEMNVGTAKPSEEELASVKHHLVNIRNPDENYSSGEYRKDFDKLIKEASGIKNSINGQRDEQPDFSREIKPVIVVGGTGMYLRAALEDLDMPEYDGDLEYRKELEARPLEELQKLLQKLDRDAYHSIDIHNKRRLARAIEFVEKTGEKFSAQKKKLSNDRYGVQWIGLNFENREDLYELIDLRVHKMIEAGLVDEVKALFEKYGKTNILMNTIGYGEIIEYLEGELSLDQAIALIQKKTRNYAKRQVTWFKSNPRIKWVS